MKHYFNSSIKTFLAFLAIGLCASCSDVWDSHYSVDPEVVPDMTILEQLESNPSTQQFVKVLKTTKTYNGKKIVDAVTYYDLLKSDQFLTVWAPDDKAMAELPDLAAYTKENKTPEENYLVSQRFLKNHIARFNNPVGKVGKRVTMMSGKHYEMFLDRIQSAGYTSKNLACSNGILHIISGSIDYKPSLYEYITTSDEYKENIGGFIAKYTKYEIDEAKSVAAGVVDGKTVYADSVMKEVSIILDKFGYINREDSLYNVVLPNKDALNSMIKKISDNFDFGNIDTEDDSLQTFWLNNAILTDAFFNMNKATQPFMTTDDNDYSFFASTTFNLDEYLETYKDYHIYDMTPGNRFFDACLVDSVECSNGTIYVCSEWPFDPSRTYNAPIMREAEMANGRIPSVEVTNVTEYTVLNIKNEEYLEEPIYLDQISRQKLLIINGKNAVTDRWKVTFNIYDNLKGYYNIYAVVFPNCITGNIVPPKTNMFTAKVNYVDTTGVYQEYYMTDARRRAMTFENRKAVVDTIMIADHLFLHNCNLGQPDARVEVVLECNITSSKVSQGYSNTMLLDGILLEPVEKPAEKPVE